eukprot:TRINITY_DN5387_c0_g1_i1.p1 TRINITY_DN5387_c0_g1~~TRINITY_DN5387_c0_g1_i1.p1  ORF type:complete len:677 (-),score=189.38 TRINITY_DN5387_c0_g1_i1:40-1848(-)
MEQVKTAGVMVKETVVQATGTVVQATNAVVSVVTDEENQKMVINGVKEVGTTVVKTGETVVTTIADPEKRDALVQGVVKVTNDVSTQVKNEVKMAREDEEYAAKLAGRAIGAGFVAKNALENAAVEAGVRVAAVIDDNLTDEHKAKLEQLALQGKELAKRAAPLAVEAGAHIMEGVEYAKRKQEEAWERVYANMNDEQKQQLAAANESYLLKKEKLKLNLLDVADGAVDRVLQKAKMQACKAATSDPDMFEFVKQGVEAVINDIWKDVAVQVKKELTAAVLEKDDEDQQLEEKNALQQQGCISPRSWILYHYLPYDKSAFGKFRDPAYLFLFVLTLIPVYCIRLALFVGLFVLLWSRGAADEGQIIDFVLNFKGMQFLTGGIILGLVGAARYYVCVLYGTCIEGAPGVSEGMIFSLVEFFGTVLLVWIAIFSLRFTEKHGKLKFKIQQQQQTSSNASATTIDEELGQVNCCGCTEYASRGGRLRSLLRLDIYGFLLSCVFFVGLCMLNGGFQATLDQPWRLQSNIYWARVMYGLLSVPFFVFIIPGVSDLLMHHDQTGFNQTGKCVRFQLRKKQQQLQDADNSQQQVPLISSGSHYVTISSQ